MVKVVAEYRWSLWGQVTPPNGERFSALLERLQDYDPGLLPKFNLTYLCYLLINLIMFKELDMRFVLLFIFAAVLAEDPKVGDTREKVIGLLGKPNGNLTLRDGAEVFSYPRGDVFFDKKGVCKQTLLPEAEFKRLEESRARPAVPAPVEVAATSKTFVASLLVNFEAVPTIPGAPSIYRHKAFPVNKYGLMPCVYVAADGALALATNYYGGRWIFHDSASIGIGDKSYFTSVSGVGEPSRRVAQAGFIYESCVFETEDDQKIIRDIAKAKGVKIVIAVCRGRGSVLGQLSDQQFSAFPPLVELKPEEVKAVYQSVELADAFLRLKNGK
jgi:hypothetical protein